MENGVELRTLRRSLLEHLLWSLVALIHEDKTMRINGHEIDTKTVVLALAAAFVILLLFAFFSTL